MKKIFIQETVLVSKMGYDFAAMQLCRGIGSTNPLKQARLAIGELRVANAPKWLVNHVCIHVYTACKAKIDAGFDVLAS